MVVTKFFLLNRVGSFVMRAFACKIILLRLFFLLLNQQIILCGSFQESEERGELLGVEVLELLKKFPNFENAPLLGGDTPLHVACRWGLYETFDSILNSNSSSIHAVNANGDTPLLVAAFHGYRLFVEKLIRCGAEIDERGYDGGTALHCAAAEGKFKVLTFLLKKGARLDLKDDNGNTALHFAVSGEHILCVEQLLQHGALIYEVNDQEETPLSLASDDDIYNLLYNFDNQSSVDRKKIKGEDTSDEDEDEGFDIFLKL